MASIEEQRQQLNEILATQIRNMSGPDFAVNMKRMLYQQAFLARLPTLAPAAWTALMQHRTDTDALIVSSLQAGNGINVDDVLPILLPKATAWCRNFNVSTRNGWMEHTAAWELIWQPLYQALGVPCDRFSRFDQILFDDKGIQVESREFHPHASTKIQVDLAPLYWDRINETEAQFRKRAIAEYRQRLDEQILQLDGDHLAPKLAEVNHLWVDWTVLRRPGRLSVSVAAKTARVDRKSLREGVKAASKVLQFTDPPDGGMDERS